jgi:hypothetical protein
MTGKKLELNGRKNFSGSEICAPSMINPLGIELGGEKLTSFFSSPKMSLFKLSLQKDFQLSFFDDLSPVC